MAHAPAVPGEDNVFGAAAILGSGGEKVADGHSKHRCAEHLQYVSSGVDVVFAAHVSGGLRMVKVSGKELSWNLYSKPLII